ncbi:MAG: hypothetical protein M0P70_04055 [Desulfobulbaceae bacterium]|nr:hypothetical protein [Desulfobulbaceae bacterium]
MKKQPLLLSLLLAAVLLCSEIEAHAVLAADLSGANSPLTASAPGFADKRQAAVGGPAMDTTFHIPLLGDRDAGSYSLPVLGAILGLVDGFNPCAMWVLVYLISLIMGLNDRKKIWLLVGSFLMASGVLYFLFMTAWLNAFLFIGYLRPLTLLIGLFALWTGIKNIREFIVTRGAVACKVTDGAAKQKTMGRIRQLVASPLTLASIFGIIALAFAVNSIEFLCSAGIPAIFTHVLAISAKSSLQYYAYILLYVFFFMLDDLLIFTSAVFAVNSSCGEKYTRHCKALGGIIMVVLGVLLTFFPDMLR